MFSAAAGRRTTERLRQKRPETLGLATTTASGGREGGAGKISKCVGKMENKKALERRGKERGKRVKKLHTNPKPSQEQEM